MTDTLIIAALAIGCMIAIAFTGWLLRPRKQRPEPMEYQEPRVMTRIWDGNANINKEN